MDVICWGYIWSWWQTYYWYSTIYKAQELKLPCYTHKQSSSYYPFSDTITSNRNIRLFTLVKWNFSVIGKFVSFAGWLSWKVWHFSCHCQYQEILSSLDQRFLPFSLKSVVLFGFCFVTATLCGTSHKRAQSKEEVWCEEVTGYRLGGGGAGAGGTQLQRLFP